jgi:MtrB/PioB family decaheme-associated outer membrane protein
MKTRTGFLVTTAVVALMVGMGGQAFAADLVTKAPPAVVETGWWQTGWVEIGGRFFIEDHGGGTGGNFRTGPADPDNRLSAGPFASLGKFYEYRDWRPGPFGNLSLSAGTLNGLYQYDFTAKNIGYRDQSYLFDWSQAGVQYLTLGFDEMPHTYNNNATTIFQGAGSDTLTVDPAVRGILAANQVGFSPAKAAATADTIENNLNPFRLGFDRYTGNADYRWTPSDPWDVKVDYNVTRRDGTQPGGALTFNGIERGGRIVLELPRPIHDETHIANANVEYVGATPWGKFNVIGGYGISIYHDDSDSFTFQNPFAVANAPQFPTFTPLLNTMSLAPSNSAHMFRLIGAVDLPLMSRWQGAVNYTRGEQNQGFLPISATPGLVGGTGFTIPTFVSNGVPPVLTGGSDFHSDTLLVNNVLTTKWTRELTQTSRYRFYDYRAPDDLTLSYLLLGDSANATDPEDAFIRRGMSYAKQNAGSDLAWHPNSWLTLGGGGGWEQWDRHLRSADPGDPDVHVTNEWMGKVFGSIKPWDTSQLRGSFIHAERRFEGEYQQNIGGNDESCETDTTVCTGFRAYDLANRNREKGTLWWDFFLPYNLTITPSGGFRIDDYSHWMFLDQTGGGLVHDNAWNAGIEASLRISSDVILIGSYMHEDGHKELWIPFTSHSILVPPGGPPFSSPVDDHIDTFTAGANWAVIPGKFDIKATYTLMVATASIGTPPANPLAFFPDQHQTLNRVDVQAKYQVDPWFMQRFGFRGETYVKLRYLWEDNNVTDWAADNWNYQYLFNTDTSQTKNIFLGWNNPNYNVQLLALSVGFKW